MGLDKCKTCGGRLETGPVETRMAESATWKIEIIGIPTMKCSRGCQVSYWYHPDFGAEVIDMLGVNRECIARKRGFIIIRQVCRACNRVLSESLTTRLIALKRTLRNGSTIELLIKGPLLKCENCRRDYLPAEGSTHDDRYWELAGLINETLTKDLIWE